MVAWEGQSQLNLPYLYFPMDSESDKGSRVNKQGREKKVIWWRLNERRMRARRYVWM